MSDLSRGFLTGLKVIFWPPGAIKDILGYIKEGQTIEPDEVDTSSEISLEDVARYLREIENGSC